MVEHPESGDGIYIRTREAGGEVIPGTVLGFFPGVVCDPTIPFPQHKEASVLPYLRRLDGFWIDHLKDIPYPNPLRMNFQDLHEEFVA